MSTAPSRWKIFKSRSPFSWGQWYAVCIAANGKKRAHTETYHNLQDCADTIDDVKAATFDRDDEPIREPKP